MPQIYDEGTKEINDDDLKRELQELLDSQLEKSNDETCVDNKEGIIKDKVIEEAIQVVGEEPTKEFRVSEIQAFLNNQVRKQHQLQVQMVEQYEHREQEDADHGQAEPQQHVILVTQNGDKIILIQNPNAAGSADASELDSSAAAVAAAVGAGDKDRQLIPQIEYQPSVEIDEQEEYQIQMQHKFRQKMLLMQLDKLRGRKKASDTSSILPAGVQNDENLMYSSATNTDDLNQNQEDDNDSQWITRPIRRSSPSRKRNFELAKAALNVKWYHLLNVYLDKAYNYVKRRGQKIEQVCRFFPTASHSFDTRCQELKEELLKLELNIERFQNILNKDLESAENKMKNFLRDFHLESLMSELDNEDDADLNDVPSPSPAAPNQIIIDHPAALCGSSSNIQLITPPDLTITATCNTETTYDADIEPVAEIRDVYDNEPVKEIRDVESPIEMYGDVETRAIPIFRTTVKPTVSVKPAQMAKATGIVRPSKFKFKSKSRSRTDVIKPNASMCFHKVYKCKHAGCYLEFDSNVALITHLNEHLLDEQDQIEDEGEADDEQDYEKMDEDVIDGSLNSVHHVDTDSLLSVNKIGGSKSQANGVSSPEPRKSSNQAKNAKRLRTDLDSGIQLFYCNECGVGFKYRRSLNKHYQTSDCKDTRAEQNDPLSDELMNEPENLSSSVPHVTMQKLGGHSVILLKSHEKAASKERPCSTSFSRPGPASKTNRRPYNTAIPPELFDTDQPQEIDETLLKKLCMENNSKVILTPLDESQLELIDSWYDFL